MEKFPKIFPDKSLKELIKKTLDAEIFGSFLEGILGSFLEGILEGLPPGRVLGKNFRIFR